MVRSTCWTFVNGILISESFAKAHFADKDPIGRTLRIGTDSATQ